VPALRGWDNDNPMPAIGVRLDMGGLYFWVSTNNIADSIPIYAQFGFLLTFLFFNSFAINMWLQYKKIGKWKVYAYGEKAYIVLSLVSKSALGWIIVLGTMGV